MDHVVDEIVNAMVNTKVGLKTIEDVLQTEQLKATLKPKVDVWYFGEPPREIIPINTENSETSPDFYYDVENFFVSAKRAENIYVWKWRSKQKFYRTRYSDEKRPDEDFAGAPSL